MHALRDSLGFIVKARLPIGKDGRNRPSLFPFGTATGRNAHSKSPYNAHAGMRSFMVFPPDTIGFYLDWRTQEVGVAAALSGDQALMDDYLSGDVYHALARLCGLTDDPDPIRWKKHNRPQRDRMKPLQLGINYGMGVPSLARGLDRHPLIASEIIERHKRRYPRFWQWRADMVQTAMLERRIESASAGRSTITTSPNQRTLYNFPMQSGGAEMLRLADRAAVRRRHRANHADPRRHPVRRNRSARRSSTPSRSCAAPAAMSATAWRSVSISTRRLEGGARYRDKRPMAQKMWATIMNTLQAIGALPRKEVA